MKVSPGKPEHSDSSDPWRAFVTLTKSDYVCLPRLSLCVFQVTPDFEVLRPSKEQMGARKGCCLQACLEIATPVASGCWQEVSCKPCPSLPSADECFPLLSPQWAQAAVTLLTPSSAEHSHQTTEPSCPLRARMWTSLGSATKINPKQSGGSSCWGLGEG